ncbi:MAG: hypothetical protein V1646_04870 [bacterium]
MPYPSSCPAQRLKRIVGSISNATTGSYCPAAIPMSTSPELVEEWLELDSGSM